VPKIVVCHSRKGGVGKTTLAYELAWLLDAPLVDLDWEGGTASRTWGYRWEEHPVSAIVAAIDRGVTPRPLAGRRTRRPDLVPGHPDFELHQPDAETMADLLTKWAAEWGRDWVVVDSHPGATSATNGALAVAHVVLVPVVLAMKDIFGTELTVRELAGYPLVVVPNRVPPTPPAAMLGALRRVIENTEARVAPPIPAAQAVATRRRRTAMVADDPPLKALVRVVDATRRVACFIQEYAGD
jgi:chromosome partitioning protein